MKIGEIDKNLALPTALDLPDVVWRDAKDLEIRGLAVYKKGEPFLRMPEEVAKQVNEGVQYLNTNTAGGRIRFCTDSPYIALKAVMPDNETMPHITMTGQSGFDLYQSDCGVSRYAGSYLPGNRSHGYEASRETDGQRHTYTINMPLYDPVEEVYIGLKEGASLESPEPYRYEKPVLYYGSSITQGGCASRPGNAYQAMISRELNCDFVNLGFSGSARGEEAIARYMASLDPLVFVCDYDHNAPTPEHLAATHFPLYEIFRAAHPLTPYVMVSAPDNTFGPDTRRRKQIILESFAKAVSSGDRHVYFVDGGRLFDGPFADSCTVDGCHPNDLGFCRMAEVIGRAVQTAIEEAE